MSPPSLRASRDALPAASEEVDECHAQIARQASQLHSVKIAAEETRVKL